jgi:uncharacterized protein YkwD
VVVATYRPARTIRYRLPDGRPISSEGPLAEDRSERIERSTAVDPHSQQDFIPMSIRIRHLIPLLIGIALILPAAVPAVATASTASDAEAIMLKALNYERTRRGLVALRLDSRLAAIARDRSDYQARTGDADHTQGSINVFDMIEDANIRWYAAGEIIAQNRYYPTITDSAKAAISGWLGSSTHRSIMLSKGYNYVGFGYAMNPDTKRRYWTGVFMKGPDRTRPWAKFGTVSKKSVSGGYTAVTIRWAGNDTRLQVLTSGFRYFQVQRRYPGGTWSSWPLTTSTYKTIRWKRGGTKEVRVRSRDQAGYWSPWKYLTIKH